MKPYVSKAFLHTGRDLVLENSIIVKHPKVEEILALNDGLYCEEIYWAYVFGLLSDPYNNMVFLDDNGIDYETSSPIDVLWIKWQDPKEREFIIEFLSFFLGNRDYDMAAVHDVKIIYDKTDNTFAIGPAQFEWITYFVSQINCLTQDGRINPATEGLKRILIEDMRDEIRRAKKRKKKDEKRISLIGDSITAVVYGSPSGVTPFNFEKLGIYQLLYGSISIQKQIKVQAMFNGIFTGMMKANKLPEDELRWT